MAPIVKRAAGRRPRSNEVRGYSLRDGFVTTAGRNDVPELTIMRQTGHRSLKTLAGYMREGTLNNAASKVGL